MKVDEDSKQAYSTNHHTHSYYYLVSSNTLRSIDKMNHAYRNQRDKVQSKPFE